MITKLIILDGKTLKNNFTIPYVLEGKGNFALELVLSKAAEMYYGNEAKIKIEDALKVRLSDDEITRNFTIYLEKRKL